MKKILILGASGMLGHMVAKFFLKRPEYSVTCSYRGTKPEFIPDGQAVFFNAMDDDDFILNLHPYDYIINCIGLIRQRCDTPLEDFMKVNAGLPLRLIMHCAAKKQKLIHITTDCVYSGKNRNNFYLESTPHDPDDDYGLSKSKGEMAGCMRLRTSIIGPELSNGLSLFEFVRKTDQNPIKGFINHQWNGITTLQFAKVCHKIIRDDLWVDDLRHVFSLPMSKYQLVSTINKVFNLKKNIVEFEAPESIDRILRSQFMFCHEMRIPHIEDQIEDLYGY